MDITLPSGAVFNFDGLTEHQIAEELTTLRGSNPELFQVSTLEEPSEEPSEEAALRKPSFSPTIEGQVTDYNTRWEFGKRDTVEEEEKFLTEKYGPDSFGRDDSGNYFLKLDNISPEIKANNWYCNSCIWCGPYSRVNTNWSWCRSW